MVDIVKYPPWWTSLCGWHARFFGQLRHVPGLASAESSVDPAMCQDSENARGWPPSLWIWMVHGSSSLGILPAQFVQQCQAPLLTLVKRCLVLAQSLQRLTPLYIMDESESKAAIMPARRDSRAFEQNALNIKRAV